MPFSILSWDAWNLLKYIGNTIDVGEINSSLKLKKNLVNFWMSVIALFATVLLCALQHYNLSVFQVQ